MENRNELINIEGQVASKPLKFFYLTANVYKSITYINVQTKNKITGPYRDVDNEIVSIKYLEEQKQSYSKKKKECPICFDDVRIRNMIETNCHHHYCIKCFFNIFRKNEKKCALCRRPQSGWVFSVKVELVDFIDSESYEITD